MKKRIDQKQNIFFRLILLEETAYKVNGEQKDRESGRRRRVFIILIKREKNKREKMGKDQLDFSHFEKSFDNQYDIVAPEFGDLH